VCDEVSIDLVVELTPWDQAEPYDRLGIDDRMTELLEVQVPTLRIPVRPGRDLAVIIEIAARNQLLKREGVHGARVFAERLASQATDPPTEKA
jgi:HPr kinase/phosphorylase